MEEEESETTVRNRHTNTRETSIVIDNIDDDLTLTTLATVPESPDGILALGQLLSMLHNGKSLGDCLTVLMNRSNASSSDEYKEQDPREIMEDEEFQTVMEMWNEGKSVPQILSTILSQEQSCYAMKCGNTSNADDMSIASNPDEIIALGALIEMAKDGLCPSDHDVSVRGRHTDPCDMFGLRRDGSWDTDRRDTMFDSSSDDETTELGSDASGDSISCDEDSMMGEESEIRRETASKANRRNITRYLWKRRKIAHKSRYAALTGVEAVMDESKFDKRLTEPTAAPTSTDTNTDISTNKKNRAPNLLSKMRGRSSKGTKGDDVPSSRKRSKSPAFSNLKWRRGNKAGAEYETMKDAGDFEPVDKMKPANMSARSHTSDSETTQPTSGGRSRRLSGGSILQDLKASDLFDDILKDLETSNVEKREKSHKRSVRDHKDHQPIARDAKTPLNSGKDGGKKPTSILRSKRNVSEGTKSSTSTAASEFEHEVAKVTGAAVIRNMKEEHDMNGQEVQLGVGSLASEMQITSKIESKEQIPRANKRVGADSGKKQSQARRSAEKVAKKLVDKEADKPTPKAKKEFPINSGKSPSQARKSAEKVAKKLVVKAADKPTPKAKKELPTDSDKSPSQTRKPVEKIAKNLVAKKTDKPAPKAKKEISADSGKSSNQTKKTTEKFAKKPIIKESETPIPKVSKHLATDSSRKPIHTGKSSDKATKKLDIKQTSDLRGEEAKNGEEAEIPVTPKTSKKATISKEPNIRNAHEDQVGGVRSMTSEKQIAPTKDVAKPTTTGNESSDTSLGKSPSHARKEVDKATKGLAIKSRPNINSAEVSRKTSSEDPMLREASFIPPNTAKSFNTEEPKASEKTNPLDLSIARTTSIVSSIGQEVELSEVGGSIEPLAGIPEQNDEGADDNVPTTNPPSARVADNCSEDVDKSNVTKTAIPTASNELHPAIQEAFAQSEPTVNASAPNESTGNSAAKRARDASDIPPIANMPSSSVAREQEFGNIKDETERVAEKETAATKKKTVHVTRSVPSFKKMPFSRVIQELKLSRNRDEKDSSKTPEPKVARPIPPITDIPSSIGQELELTSSKKDDKVAAGILPETKTEPVARSIPPITNMPSSVGQELELISSKASKTNAADVPENKATPVAPSPPIPLSSMPSAVGQEIELVSKTAGKTNKTAAPETKTAFAAQEESASVSESTQGVPSLKTRSGDSGDQEKKSTELTAIDKVDGVVSLKLTDEDAKSEPASADTQFGALSVRHETKASVDLEPDTSGHLVKANKEEELQPEVIDKRDESTRPTTVAEKVEPETGEDNLIKSPESSTAKADQATPKRKNFPKFLSGIGFSLRKTSQAATKAEDYAPLESDGSLDEPYDLSELPSSIGQEVVSMNLRAPTLSATTETWDEEEKPACRPTTQDESKEESKESDAMPPTPIEEGDDGEAAEPSSAAMKENINPPWATIKVEEGNILPSQGDEITLKTAPKEETKAKQEDAKDLETISGMMKEEASSKGPKDGAETEDNDEASLPSRSQKVSAVDDTASSNPTEPSDDALLSPKPERSTDKTAEVVSTKNEAGRPCVPSAFTSPESGKTAIELACNSVCTGDETDVAAGAAADKAENTIHQKYQLAKQESEEKSQEVKLKLVSATDEAAADKAESTIHQKDRFAKQESEEKSQVVEPKPVSSPLGGKKAKRKSGFGRMVKRVLKGKKDAEEVTNGGEKASKVDAVTSKAPNRLMRRVFKGKKRRRNAAGVEKLASIPESGEAIVNSADDKAVLHVNSRDDDVGMGPKNEKALNVTNTEEQIEEKPLEAVSNMISENQVNSAAKEVPATSTAVSSSVDADATGDREEVDDKEGSGKEEETALNESDAKDEKLASKPLETASEDTDNSVHSATAALAAVSSFTLGAINQVSSFASEASDAIKQNANNDKSGSIGSVGASSFPMHAIDRAASGLVSATSMISAASSTSSKISHNEETGVGVFLNSGPGDDEFETCFDTEDGGGQTPCDDSETPPNPMLEEGITKKGTDDSSENSKTQSRDDKENNGCAIEIKRTMATPLATRDADSKQEVDTRTSAGSDFEPTATLVTVPELKLGDGGFEYRENSFIRLQM